MHKFSLLALSGQWCPPNPTGFYLFVVGLFYCRIHVFDFLSYHPYIMAACDMSWPVGCEQYCGPAAVAHTCSHSLASSLHFQVTAVLQLAGALHENKPHAYTGGLCMKTGHTRISQHNVRLILKTINPENVMRAVPAT